jgi:hypothetical protein
MRVKIVRAELSTDDGAAHNIDMQDFACLCNETCTMLEGEGYKVVDMDFERFRSHATAFIKYRKRFIMKRFKSILRDIFIVGLPVWVVMLGAILMIAGGINDIGGGVFQAIERSDNVWVLIGAIVTGVGMGIFVVWLIGAFRNKMK